MTKEKEHILWIVLGLVIVVAMVLIAWMSDFAKTPTSLNQPTVIQNNSSQQSVGTNTSEVATNDDAAQEVIPGSVDDAFVEFEEAPEIMTQEEIEQKNREEFPEVPAIPESEIPTVELDAASLQAAPLN